MINLPTVRIFQCRLLLHLLAGTVPVRAMMSYFSFLCFSSTMSSGCPSSSTNSTRSFLYVPSCLASWDGKRAGILTGSTN